LEGFCPCARKWTNIRHMGPLESRMPPSPGLAQTSPTAHFLKGFALVPGNGSILNILWRARGIPPAARQPGNQII
jgi:hypothetical protein